MTIGEMNEQIAKIKFDCDAAINALRRKYAIEHNPYAVGDIIVHCNGEIGKINSIKWSISSADVPQAVYEITLLNKDLSPKKVSKKRAYDPPPKFWQQNVTGKL